jgi:hypothetical protein
MMHTFLNSPSIQKLKQEMEISRQQKLIEATETDPDKYWLSTLIADNKPATYQYVTVLKTKSSEHRWCAACHKNIAGYYLIWYEIETKTRLKRKHFTAEQKRKDAYAYIKRKIRPE